MGKLFPRFPGITKSSKSMAYLWAGQIGIVVHALSPGEGPTQVRHKLSGQSKWKVKGTQPGFSLDQPSAKGRKGIKPLQLSQNNPVALQRTPSENNLLFPIGSAGEITTQNLGFGAGKIYPDLNHAGSGAPNDGGGCHQFLQQRQ
jgi:hypothetical protein